ncbi:ribonuclease H-like domain-containing protein [Tanacetum coccineum]
MQIRSYILSIDVLPDVRIAYATISSEESHKVAFGSVSGFSQRNQASTCVSNVPNRANFHRGQSSNTAHRPNNLNNNKQSGGFESEKSYGDWLGHPADLVLNVLKDDLKIENKSQIKFCEICQGAKQTREHFPISDHTSSKLGDLVHLDLWEPYKVISSEGFSIMLLLRGNIGFSHLRVFGYICFATIVNNHDKLVSRVDPKLNSDQRSHSDSSHSLVPCRDMNIADFSDDKSENDAQSSDDIFAAQDEQTDAMNSEMDSLLRNDTWEIVDLPKDRKAIGNKWIFKIIYKFSGEIDRYKAKLVAHDVNNAFLNGDLIETLYMKAPEGYFPLGNKVCMLKKSLYGLKQAPRQWNAKLTSALIKNGFSQSKSDYSLYTKFDKGVFLALLVYVDDIIITGNNISELEKFKFYLKSTFMIKDLGKLKYFLGIEVIDTHKGICLNQRKYVLDLLSKYGMLACKPAKTPLMSKLYISNEVTDNDPTLDNITDYQKLIDADWAKCVVTRRSVTSYFVFLNNSVVSWKSRKQNTLSKSLTEAEYRALASVTSEVI